ncbi:MAG: PhnD/SsuA/transferrin family substrate-binding protein, partial [Chloroflexi bacterium]|nr:PhnD/SsuA/transferrin family substrate-binding protein [Chloroflexota bacterium]
SKKLTQLSGYQVTTEITDTYDLLLTEMKLGHVQIAWLPPFTYMIASDKNYADVALMTNHFGVYSYGIQFLANVDSNFTPYFDPGQNSDTAASGDALKQFDGKRPCWVDLQSASGYVVAKGLLDEANVNTLDGVITQSHSALIRALYINGICDFGVTFAISGDPRTAESILTELPDVMEKVAVIWRSDAIIPNLNVTFSPFIPGAIRQEVTQALLDYSKTVEGKAALTTFNQYDISELKVVDDSYYDVLRTVQVDSQVKLSTLLGK